MDTGYSVDVMSQLVYQNGAIDYQNPENFDTGRSRQYSRSRKSFVDSPSRWGMSRLKDLVASIIGPVL